MSVSSEFSQSPEVARGLKTRRRYKAFLRHRERLNVPRGLAAMPESLRNFWTFLAAWHCGHANAAPARLFASHFGVSLRRVMDWKQELIRVYHKPIAGASGYPGGPRLTGANKRGIFVVISQEEALNYIKEISWRIREMEALKNAFIFAVEKAGIITRQKSFDFERSTRDWLKRYKKELKNRLP